jgi:catechol 2,3-dioxygenase-like lactoylglutathione lyase family enzyme
MESTVRPSPRREGAVAVHSLHRFVFTVPDLDVANAFYTDFGLDVRSVGERLDLHTFGHDHRWGSLYQAEGPKRLRYVSFGAYADDYDGIVRRMKEQGVATIQPHALADEDGTWFADPDGTAVQLVVSRKVTPAEKTPGTAREPVVGHAAAPSRAVAGKVRPRRLSHILLFSSDVQRSVRFYSDTLGLRLSDYSGDIIAFLHGAHASDHHLIAFAKSDGPGLHHSSWDVATLDDVGLGMQQMLDRGHPHGWGVGRHVLGSNYFYYVKDPWGSFAEYSFDIDFVPHDLDWPAADHPPEDSFYVWGPPPLEEFVENHEA